MVHITNKIQIPEDELEFKYTRSSGPGGQNVNKLNTRVELFFDVQRCTSLNDDQKQRIMNRLATRISKQGVLRLVSQKYRTQQGNRDAVVQRLVELIQGALQQQRKRKPTKVPYGVKQKRLDEKKKRSQIKRQRSEKFD